MYLRSFHIIEGVSELRSTLKELIEYHGYKAMVFDSIESYLTYFHSTAFSRPVAILADYKMNKQAEMKVLTTVRKRMPKQNIVLLAGFFDTELERDLQFYSCQLLPLPHGINDLPAMLHSLLEDEQASPLDNLLLD